MFVTWRLGDSLPKAKLDQWKEERAIWLSHHPEPWDEKTEAEFHARFSSQMDEWLDQGSGSCVLKDPGNAGIVADALRHFDGERYEIASFVVMPNHVHVLFRPLGKHTLPEILKSWKGFTARKINKRIGKTGALWQNEYWDRLIRSERHFFKVAEYIRENPVKAGFKESGFVWEGGFFGSTSSGKYGGQECPPSCGGLENPPSVRVPSDIPGRLEAKVKTFCSIPNILSFLKDYIVFAEKDEELNKYILRQHQTGAVEATVGRALDSMRKRGLVWHTQGSGKTFTMIKAAELLFRAPEADKPTLLLMIDRNELEDQMLKNLAALGLGNLEHAGSIARLNQLLRDDYRGIIVTMIHKFRDMPADLNTRSNIYVLIDEAHRTTGGDNDSALLKEFHLDPKKERQIRKSFGKLDQQPKILIVTEKLLTGFDAPVLYAMYLDKPMRDHTLLQAIARVNRPYENEAQEMVKPHGFVLDFIGIFDKLEKALAFDSEEINAIVKDLKLLKVLFAVLAECDDLDQVTALVNDLFRILEKADRI